MKVESVTFLSDLKDVTDILDDNVDVAVKLDDGHEYIIVVAIQKFLTDSINGEKMYAVFNLLNVRPKSLS